MTGKTKALLRFALSGPNTDRSFETANVAMSAAITAAEALGKNNPGVFYVRDFNGQEVGRVTHDKDGNTNIRTAKFIGATP